MKGGSCEEEVARQRGGGEHQEMPTRGRRADGGAGGIAAKEMVQTMNTSAGRGKVTTGDRSRVDKSKEEAAAGVQSSTSVGSTVMDRVRMGGADKVSRCRVQRGLVTGQLRGEWRIAQGRHITGTARKKGHPPLGLDGPGQRVVQSTGPERPGRSKTARRQPLDCNTEGMWTCAPGTEHPG